MGTSSFTEISPEAAYNAGITAGALSAFFLDPATGTLSSFARIHNEKEPGMGDEETSPSSSGAHFPVFGQKSELGAQPDVMETPRMLQRIPTDPVCDLSDQVETTEQFSVAHGGFSDIYKGIWAQPFGGEAGKIVVRIYFVPTKWSWGFMMVGVTGGNKITASLHKAGGGPCTSTKGELQYFCRHVYLN